MKFIKNKKKFIIRILIVLVLCIAGGLAWFFGYYRKTPSYSIYLIRQSVEKHDTASFETHVNLDSLLSHCYDDAISAAREKMKKEKGDEEFATATFDGLAAALKPSLTTELKDKLVSWVKDGKWELGKENKKGKSAADSMADHTRVESMKFKGIAYTKINGNTANIGVTLEDKDLTKPFIMDVEMKQLPDGTWQAERITNMKEYLEMTEH